jgi:hypothetical protein
MTDQHPGHRMSRLEELQTMPLDELARRVFLGVYGDRDHRMAQEVLASRERRRESAVAEEANELARNANALAEASNATAREANDLARSANSTASDAAASARRTAAEARLANMIAIPSAIAAAIAIAMSTYALMHSGHVGAANAVQTKAPTQTQTHGNGAPSAVHRNGP